MASSAVPSIANLYIWIFFLKEGIFCMLQIPPIKSDYGKNTLMTLFVFLKILLRYKSTCESIHMVREAPL